MCHWSTSSQLWQLVHCCEQMCPTKKINQLIHHFLEQYQCILVDEDSASIHQANVRLAGISREVSKPRYSGLDFFNRSGIWQAPRQQRRSLWHPTSRLRDFTRSCGKTSVSLLHRGPITLTQWSMEETDIIANQSFISKIDILSISCEIAFGWVIQDLADAYSTLVRVMTGAVRQQAITSEPVFIKFCANIWRHN